MIDRAHPSLSVVRQCRLLAVSRSTLYYRPLGESAETLELMRRIDELYLKYPFYGSRQMVRHLAREGVAVGRHRVRRLMRLLGLEAIYRKPRTTVANPEHRVYPYLLRGLTIERPNQVWCADITYIPVQGGFFYLVAIMDWASRRVLAWQLSNTLDTAFCLEALAEALAGYGIPEIFNTDQGSQFTSIAFTGALEASAIRCSMDGRGRCMDNVFIERLWRSLKYEAVYLSELEDGFEAQQMIAEWIGFYNEVPTSLGVEWTYTGRGLPIWQGARSAGGVAEWEGRCSYQLRAHGASGCGTWSGELSTYPQAWTPPAPGPPTPRYRHPSLREGGVG